jgi:hypothetical protein
MSQQPALTADQKKLNDAWKSICVQNSTRTAPMR